MSFNKQTISFLIYLSLCPSVAQPMQYVPFYNQEKDKKEFFFKDGVSFDALEKKIREKHPEMPKTVLIQYILDHEFIYNDFVNKIPSMFYWPKTLKRFDYQQKTDSLNTIKRNYNDPYNYSFSIAKNAEQLTKERAKTDAILVHQACKSRNSNEIHWGLLHETGHSQMPYNIPCIGAARIGAFFSSAYFWKKRIGTKPYKNIITKLGSKFTAAVLLSRLLETTALNLEERRADNWANKNSDIKILEGGLSYLKYLQKHLQEVHKETACLQPLPFCIGQYLIDPVHPSIQSRINKIERALESRK